MSSKLVASLAPILLLTSLGSAALRTGGEPTPRQQSAVPDGEGAWVQVTSVTIQPTTIHRSAEPNAAVVTVQMIVHGQPPRNATAKVEVATYSADPSGNNAAYSEIQTVRLSDKLMALKFSVRSDSTTVPGKLTVAGSVDEATTGVKIKQPDANKNWLAELHIAEP